MSGTRDMKKTRVPDADYLHIFPPIFLIYLKLLIIACVFKKSDMLNHHQNVSQGPCVDGPCP
jgi:hypothetical protein